MSASVPGIAFSVPENLGTHSGWNWCNLRRAMWRSWFWGSQGTWAAIGFRSMERARKRDGRGVRSGRLLPPFVALGRPCEPTPRSDSASASGAGQLCAQVPKVVEGLQLPSWRGPLLGAGGSRSLGSSLRPPRSTSAPRRARATCLDPACRRARCRCAATAAVALERVSAWVSGGAGVEAKVLPMLALQNSDVAGCHRHRTSAAEKTISPNAAGRGQCWTSCGRARTAM